MRAGTLDRVLVFAAIALIAAAALCLLDGDGGPGSDLCGAFLVLTATLLLAFPLAPVGRSALAVVRARPLYLPDLAAPPPKA